MPSRVEPRAQVPWRALTFAVVAVVVGLGAGFLMLRLADSGGVDVRLGDSEFSAGTAASRSLTMSLGSHKSVLDQVHAQFWNVSVYGLV